MALTYKKEIVTRSYEDVTLEVHDHWGMFTTAGNRKLRAYAEKLVQDVSVDGADKLKAFKDYFLKYQRFQNNPPKSMGEAGDTSVRESVWGFAEDVGKCVGYGYHTLDDLWNEARDQACKERKV